MEGQFKMGRSVGAAPAGSVRSVERALAVIRLLAEERRSLGVAEIGASTGLPQATVHRLLATLVGSGWVDQSRYTSRYRLGHGILGAAAIALAHAPLLDRGRPILSRVADLSGLSAYLSVRVGRRVTFLARATAEFGEQDDFHPGITQPAHCTAAGKILLASLSSADRRRLFRDAPGLRRYTPNTITDLTALEEELKAIAERGYATDGGEFKELWRSVAVPIRGLDGAVTAAMSCGGPADRMTSELMSAIRGEMAVLAEDLSRQIGLGED
jgi:DNA-binding IclR family transcriptional regulator